MAKSDYQDGLEGREHMNWFGLCFNEKQMKDNEDGSKERLRIEAERKAREDDKD